MIWQQWHHYIYSVRGNCKLFFQAVDTPGGESLLTTLRREKNIWLLFDVDKLPGAIKTELGSLALSLFFPRSDKQPQNLFRGESRRDGLQVIAPSCEGMDVGGVIGSTAAEREEEWESESAPSSSLHVLAASCLTASKTIRPFFLPFTPLKKSDCGTRHNI